MFITSQIFGGLALIALFITFQSKQKKYLVIWNGATMMFAAIMFAFLGNWVVVAMLGIGIIRNLVLLVLDKYEKTPKLVRHTVMVILIIATAVAGWFTQYFWYDWILIVISVLFVPVIFFGRLHLFRMCCVIYASTMLAHNIMHLVWMGIALEVTSLISIAIFYVRLTVGRAIKEDESLCNQNKLEEQID